MIRDQYLLATDVDKLSHIVVVTSLIVLVQLEREETKTKGAMVF